MSYGIVLAEWCENGVLSEYSKERIEVGAELLKKGVMKKLILSGGVKMRPGYEKILGNNENLAKIMEKYALEIGVDKDKIILEDLSEDTVGQLIFLKYGIFETRGINSGIIITHDYHAQKTIEITEAVLGKNHRFGYFLIPSEKDYRTGKRDAQYFRRTFYGVNFDSKDEVLNCLFEKHIFYNHDSEFYREELNKMIERNLLWK